MKKSNLVSIKQSIGTKLFRTVFPLYLLIAIITTLFHMWVEFNNTKQHVFQELVAVSNAIQPGLSTAVWGFDYVQLDAIIFGTKNLPIITGIQLVDESVEMIADAVQVKDAQAMKHSYQDQVPGLMSESILYSSPLYYQDKFGKNLIGQLTLYSNSQIVFKRIKMGFILILVNSLIKSLALLILFITFSRIIISQPLQELTHRVNKTRLDNVFEGPRNNFVSSGNNELSVLTDTFEAMLDQLSRSQEQLKSYAEQLEMKVSERTSELASREEILQGAYAHLQESRDTEIKTLNDKKQFIADISHELRTPLSVLTLQIEAMQKGMANKEKCYAVLQRHINQMACLIDDLYTLSKADINQLSLQYETFDISVLLEELLEPYQQMAQKRQLQLRLLRGDDCNPIIRADWDRLSQVFSNLINNSLNYTNSGGDICIHLRAGQQRVEIIIEDSYPGVSDDNLPHLFKRLFRVEESRNRNTGGSGLGLAICESIISAHEGSISLHHSELGGLKVIITLARIDVLKESS
ncbi:MAG: hypothetical protein HRU20_29230 [Pseudomonadales bacterium]|nr:hypothetical protein [Pseudomonadales bacterium]